MIVRIVSNCRSGFRSQILRAGAEAFIANYVRTQDWHWIFNCGVKIKLVTVITIVSNIDISRSAVYRFALSLITDVAIINNIIRAQTVISIVTLYFIAVTTTA